MAGEIACDAPTGLSLYANIRERNSGGRIWNGSSFAAYSATSGAQFTYAVDLTEQSQSGHYVGNMPTLIVGGTYDVTIKQRSGAPYLEGDLNIGGGQVEWNGEEAVPLSDLATSGQVSLGLPIKMARGVMVQNFGVLFRSFADGKTPLLSGVCSGQIQRDASTTWGTLQSGSFTNHGNGFYSVTLTSGDLLANTARLLFTCQDTSGGSAIDVGMSIVLQRSSGSA